MKRLKPLTKTLLALPVAVGLAVLTAQAGSATYSFDGNPPEDIWIGGASPVGWMPAGGKP